MENSKEITERIPLLVDIYEARSGLTQILAESAVLNLKIEKLPIGDLILRELVIERKTIPDLIESMQSQRLFIQIGWMRSLCRKRALLVEGRFTCSENSNLSKGVRGALLNIATTSQTPIIRSKDKGHTREILEQLALQMSRESTPPQIVERYKKNIVPLRQLRTLAAIPRIGPKRAEALLKHFKTVRAVFDASEDELILVDGIGEANAREILKVGNTSFLGG